MLIQPAKLAMISNAILPTLISGETLYDKDNGKELATGERSLKTLGKYAVIPVYDTLVSRESYFSSGETTYTSLYNQVSEGIKVGVKDYLFDINSGGGEVTKCFATCRALESLKQKHNLNFVAVVNEYACSAAYAIACVADTIYAVKGSECGSIGVVMVRTDQTKLDADKGVEYTIFRSKELKALGNPHETLTESEIAGINNSLTIVDNEFNMYVSGHRNISIQDISAFKGQSFFSEEAKELGLVDKIIPFLSLEQITGDRGVMSETNVPEAIVPTPAGIATAVPTPTPVPVANLSETVAQAVIAERTRVLAIQKLGAELSIPATTVLHVVNAGLGLTIAKDTFGMVREAVEASQSVEMSQRPTGEVRQSLAQRTNLKG